MKKEPLLLLPCLLFVLLASAQQLLPDQKFDTYYGMKGVRKKVSELKQMAAPLNIEERKKKWAEIEEQKEKIEHWLDEIKSLRTRPKGQHQNAIEPKSKEQNQTPISEADAATASDSVPKVWSNFLASSFTEYPYLWPPDPSGDVGPSQIAVTTNGSLKVFEKRKVTDPPLLTPKVTSDILAPDQFFITLDNLFSPVFRAETEGTSDPHVHYDRLTKRWFITAIEINQPPFYENNLIFLAVSDGDRITDETSFTFYQLPSLTYKINPATPILPFLDYPSLGIDKFSVVIGGRDFFSRPDGRLDSLLTVGYVIDKKELLAGNLVVRTVRLGKITIRPFSVAGIFDSPQGVHNDDPQATKSFFAGVDFFYDGIVLAAVSYNTKNIPVDLRESLVPVQPWNDPRDITAPGSPMPIDPVDSRLFQATIHRNKVTNQISLWTAHAIAVNQNGNGDIFSYQDYVDQARTASRWYEIGSVYTVPQLKQFGTVYDPKYSGRRATMYFNPTIAANGQGHTVLGGTTSAFNQYLNVFVAGRYSGDAPGSMRPPQKATNTTAIYAPFTGFFPSPGWVYEYVGRWGDFSQTVVDPLDDQTIWTFQEYANIDDSYGTRAVQVKAPPPATPVSLRLSGNIETGILSNKADQEIIIIGKSENLSGFFDPGNDPGGPGYNRLMVKSTGGILVTNVRVVSPTTIVCKVLTKGKTPGNYQLVITNPDGQSVTINYAIESDRLPVQPSVVSVNQEVASRYVTSSGVHPNPTDRDFKLLVTAARDMSAKIVVTDPSGKQISSKGQSMTKGSNSVLLSLSGAAKGAYMVVVYNENNVPIAVHKIVKD